MRRKINLNGSDRDRLVNGYREVATTITEAIEKLCAVTPHGRDYQFNDNPDDYKMDREEHNEMIRELQHIRTYVENCMVQIGKQE